MLSAIPTLKLFGMWIFLFSCFPHKGTAFIIIIWLKRLEEWPVPWLKSICCMACKTYPVNIVFFAEFYSLQDLAGSVTMTV
jgi:hypothetical protein